MIFSKFETFKKRRIFNPAKKNDLLELKFFLENNQWRNGCPFYLEFPYEDIPTMCKDMYSRYMLKKLKQEQKAP